MRFSRSDFPTLWRRAVASVALSALVTAAIVGVGSAPTPIAAQPAADLPADLKLVHPDALGFVHVRLSDLWKHEAMAQARMIFEKAGPKAIAALDEQFVPKPSTADRVTAIILPSPDNPEEPSILAVMRFTAPFDQAVVAKSYLPYATAKKVGAKTVYVEDSGPGGLHFPDDRTLMFSDKKTLTDYLTRAPKNEGGLTEALHVAAKKPFTAAVNITALPIPPQLAENLPADLKPLFKAQTLMLTLDLAKDVTLTARLAFPTEADAKTGETAIRRAAQMAQIMLKEPRRLAEFELYERNKEQRPRPLEELPATVGAVAALGGLNFADEILADLPVKQDKNAVVGSVALPQWTTQYLSLSAMSAGLMLPGVQKVREAAARAKTSNNLKQIGLAMHNHVGLENGMFPPAAIVDKKGKKLLSWRVTILPFIEQEALYRQFKLDEPWDSEHNKKLIAMIPPTYVDPRMPAGEGKTYYKVFVGKNAGFDVVKGRKITEFTDGTSNTLMIVAGGDPVIWSKPDDIEFDADKDVPDLTKPFGNVMAALFDGSVRVISPKAAKDQTLMKNLIQINDGNVIPEY